MGRGGGGVCLASKALQASRIGRPWGVGRGQGGGVLGVGIGTSVDDFGECARCVAHNAEPGMFKLKRPLLLLTHSICCCCCCCRRHTSSCQRTAGLCACLGAALPSPTTSDLSYTSHICNSCHTHHHTFKVCATKDITLSVVAVLEWWGLSGMTCCHSSQMIRLRISEARLDMFWVFL